MKLCTFDLFGKTRMGFFRDESILDLTSVNQTVFSRIENAFGEARRSGQPLHEIVQAAVEKASQKTVGQVKLLLPFFPAEVWGAGVTYLRSREARETETVAKGMYDYVYNAKRPELFLKDSNKRCAGPDEYIGIRSDSSWTVPEPELAAVLDRDAGIIGYTIANDVSARDIEGENPLYLPQAKVYTHSCAIGPVLVTVEDISDPHTLDISMRILRGGKSVFWGSVNTSRMKRRISELIDFLVRNNTIQDFTVLMTGTGIVPPDNFSLHDNDIVEIEIDRIGLLRNLVKKL